MKISDPAGQTWRVSRRWVPWRRRLKGSMDGVGIGHDFDIPAGDDPISAIFAIIALILMIPFLVLVLLAGFEFLILLVFLPFAILGRVLFGKHWTIEARKGWQPHWEGPAGDWRESGVRIHDVSAAIERGELPEQTLNL